MPRACRLLVIAFQSLNLQPSRHGVASHDDPPMSLPYAKTTQRVDTTSDLPFVYCIIILRFVKKSITLQRIEVLILIVLCVGLYLSRSLRHKHQRFTLIIIIGFNQLWSLEEFTLIPASGQSL